MDPAGVAFFFSFRRRGRTHSTHSPPASSVYVRCYRKENTRQPWSWFGPLNLPRPQGPAGPQPKRAKDSLDPTLAAASAPPLDQGDDGEGPSSAAWCERGQGSPEAQDVKAPREGSSRPPAPPPGLRATPRCDPRRPPLGSANRRLPTRCEKIARPPRHPCLLRWDRCGGIDTSQVEKLQKNSHDRRDKTQRPAGRQRKEVDGKSRATDDAGNFFACESTVLRERKHWPRASTVLHGQRPARPRPVTLYRRPTAVAGHGSQARLPRLGDAGITAGVR